MKRFYKHVAVLQTPSGYSITLDGTDIKTPLRVPLEAPTHPLALLMQEEWESQGDTINHETMPITQIITTALDRVHKDRSEIEKNVLAYLDTDMICYRAEQPETYSRRQAGAWNPWIDWFEEKTGDRLLTTTALTALKQSEKNIEYTSEYINNLDLWNFTLFQLLVSITGSVVLSMAFMEKQIDSEALFDLSHVEDLLKSEIYNEDFYGLDTTQERKWNITKRDFIAVRKILETL